MEKRHQTFAELSLDLSWNKSYTYLAWRLRRKTRTGGGTFRGLFAKGKFLFQLSRKYVGVASDSFPAGKSQVFQDLGPPNFPQVYVNRSYRKHMFIIWDSPAAYNDFAAGGWGNTFAVRRIGSGQTVPATTLKAGRTAIWTYAWKGGSVNGEWVTQAAAVPTTPKKCGTQFNDSHLGAQ